MVDRIVTSVSERRRTIVDVIRGARREISLSLFRCNDDEVLDELAAATARGVDVNVLVTSRVKGGAKKIKKLWKALERTGASVHAFSDPVVKYHAKYLVADDGPAIVASCNFTRKCFDQTCDAIVVTYDPAVVDGLRKLMKADREGVPAPTSITSRLVIGPERARLQLTALVTGAKSRVQLIDAKLSDPDMVSRLEVLRSFGLKVDVYTTKRLGELKSHGKIMLLDGRTAVVGSLALAALSLDLRREVAIVVDEPSAVAEVEQLFQTIGATPVAGRITAGEASPEARC
jgi:phosphatidylserine/phosphatidylglycerophosphate/cardiolipin synthase-like enzyme